MLLMIQVFEDVTLLWWIFPDNSKDHGTFIVGALKMEAPLSFETSGHSPNDTASYPRKL
jgi:hypothetical protein